MPLALAVAKLLLIEFRFQVFHVLALWATDYRLQALKVLLPPHISVHHFQCHTHMKQFLQFRDHTQIIFTQLPVPVHSSPIPSFMRLAVSPFHVTKAPSVIRFNTLCKTSPCLLRWKSLPQPWTSWSSRYTFLYKLIFCSHLSEVLCLLTISWRNDQVNHQLWGHFLGGAFSVIWDANIYPCSFTEFHALLRIQAPHFTKKHPQFL